MFAMVFFTGIIALIATGHTAYYAWDKAMSHYNTVDTPLWKILIPGIIAFFAVLFTTFIFFYTIFMALAAAADALGVSCGMITLKG